MPRAIWTGSVTFGLVSIPVGLYSATEDHTVHFRQFEKGTSDRIRYRRVNESTGKEVDYDDIVEGWDAGGGQFVIVTPEELDSIAPGRSRTIEISDFVDQAEIDPIYYEKTYFLAPQGEAAEHPYALLREAMQRANRVGIATFVMRNKQYLAAIRPREDVLALETMWFADEVRDPSSQLDNLPGHPKLDKRELDMAGSLVESLTTAWDPSNYRDTYRERVMELVRAKAEGQEIVTETEEEEGGEVVDLMAALEQSLASARNRKKPGNDTGGSVKTRPDPGSMSKDQLYDEAQKRDIPGRSKMSREQLEKALREAS
ncbi:MAG TPA: Ku protein [Acidimicrobiales bacterium]|nr:Ku protein [Acidimicrobiales bacterium]